MRLKWTTKNLDDFLPLPPNFAGDSLLGMDRFLEELDVDKTDLNESYPPYNIISTGPDNKSQIEIAVAGFNEQEIKLTLEDDNVLHVKGEHITKDTRPFIHKGIASRKFHHSFKLRKDITIEDAGLSDGLLIINLKQTPEKPTSINIPIQGKKVFLAETGTQTK